VSKRLKFKRKIKGRKVRVEDRVWIYPFGLPDDELDIDFEEKSEVKKI
jgi:hypothetical protein